MWCVHPLCTHMASDMSWFNSFVWGLVGSTLLTWSTVFKRRSYIVLLYIVFITSEHTISIHTSHPALTFDGWFLHISSYTSLAASSFASFFVLPEPNGYSVPSSTNLQHLKTDKLNLQHLKTPTFWAEWLAQQMGNEGTNRSRRDLRFSVAQFHRGGLQCLYGKPVLLTVLIEPARVVGLGELWRINWLCSVPHGPSRDMGVVWVRP